MDVVGNRDAMSLSNPSSLPLIMTNSLRSARTMIVSGLSRFREYLLRSAHFFNLCFEIRLQNAVVEASAV